MAAPANAFKDSFTSPVYLLMNTAVGGEWGGPIDDAIFPQKFYIDYVRVFKLE
jgi:beta-glucanase (GH16 family)